MLGRWVVVAASSLSAGCFFQPIDYPEQPPSDAGDATGDAVDDDDGHMPDHGDVGGPSADGTSDGEAEPSDLPDGQSCQSDEQCASGRCYIEVIGSACGECIGDDDCAMGCTPPPYDGDVGSVCNQGALGAGCQSDAACVDGLMCAETIDIAGLVSRSTCGECRTDADCAAERLCAPNYDVSTISAVRLCALVGTRADGQTCDHLGSGDASCQSGACNDYAVDGLLDVGVCGECRVDADCASGLCTPTQYTDAQGFVGSQCAP